jgi:predicted amidohydrolase
MLDFFFLFNLITISVFADSSTTTNKNMSGRIASNGMTKVALLHLDFPAGEQERNIAKLREAIKIAAEHGANWIVTPELAVQGYFFYEKIGTSCIAEQPSIALKPVVDVVKDNKVTLFLGCAEKDSLTGNFYNSCLVVGPEGNILGRHRKKAIILPAERWATAGDKMEPIDCGIAKVGLLVCADSYFEYNAQDLKEKGAQLLITIANWGLGDECSPGDCWERDSAKTGLPLWVCNQTNSFEGRQTQSVVTIGGRRVLEYTGGKEAILLFDWNMKSMRLISNEFSIISGSKLRWIN